MRTNFDFAPYRRSTVGFDRLFNLLEAGARDDDGYPPFDIVKEGEDSYRITLAVAGFRPEDIERQTSREAVVAQQQQMFAVIDEIADFVTEHRIPCDWHKGGSLTVATVPCGIAIRANS